MKTTKSAKSDGSIACLEPPDQIRLLGGPPGAKIASQMAVLESWMQNYSYTHWKMLYFREKSCLAL